MLYEAKFQTIYDVIVIGAGPAGLAVAHSLTQKAPNLSIIIVEAGRSNQQRPCPVDVGLSCKGCGGICNVISGFGGCMHYGDGVKLSLMPSGRRLMDLFGEGNAYSLAQQAFELLCSYTDNRPTFSGCNISPTVHACFTKYGLSIREYPVAVISETQLKQMLDGIYKYLLKKVIFKLETTVDDVISNSNIYSVTTSSRVGSETIRGHNVVFATGRRGLITTQNLLKKLEITMLPPKASVGVRFEMRSCYLAVAGVAHPDLKISKRDSLEEKAKTFCFCGGVNGGRIKFTNYQKAFGSPIITLDGHETCERKPIGDRVLASNFGLLCQVPESKNNVEEWLEKYLIMPYKQLSGGRPIVQRLCNFRNREPELQSWARIKSSLPFEPSVSDLVTGPLYKLFSKRDHKNIVRSFDQIMEPILQLSETNKTIDNIKNEVLVMGIEMEFLWNQVAIDSYGETLRNGIFVIGDAAGIAQGIIQGMAMGLRASERIINKGKI